MKLRAQKSARRVYPKFPATRVVFNAYWNGERCQARCVVVLVGAAEKPTYWYAQHVGQERDAVEVTYCGSSFLIDDENGSGWGKVTEGMGSPEWGHGSLPPSSVIVRERVA